MTGTGHRPWVFIILLHILIDVKEAGATDESQVDEVLTDMMNMMGMMSMGESAWSPASAICDADV